MSTGWDMKGTWDAKGRWDVHERPGLSQVGLDRMRQVLAGHVGPGAVPGLVALVGRGDETHVEALGTLHAGGTEPMRRDTLFRMASLSKPITAAAVMILVEECRLVGILLTQSAMDSVHTPRLHKDFWTTAYQAIA
ncbi:serine hydrolase domain-containing protein [Nonomuraea angiospora]|uniref:serine hydrolase domain-containing protein n=1 Tax=Nonomuraea angiospora TaxID=46172 RepID=UPI0033C2D00D